MKKNKTKKLKVTVNTPISEIIEKVPKAPRILMEKYGIFCIGCPMATAETIGQGAITHGLSKKKLENLLDDLNRTR